MMITYKYQAGFTLIELMVTLTVLAIFMIIAIPSLNSVIQNNANNSLANDLVAALNYARSEAIKRGASVSVCAASDQTFTACGSNWSVGWMVFLNPTESSSFQTPLLRTQAITNTNMNITSSASIATYNSQGFANASSASLTFVVKSTGCTGTGGRNIALSFTGQPTVTNVTCP